MWLIILSPYGLKFILPWSTFSIELYLLTLARIVGRDSPVSDGKFTTTKKVQSQAISTFFLVEWIGTIWELESMPKWPAQWKSSFQKWLTGCYDCIIIFRNIPQAEFFKTQITSVSSHNAWYIAVFSIASCIPLVEDVFQNGRKILLLAARNR